MSISFSTHTFDIEGRRERICAFIDGAILAFNMQRVLSLFGWGRKCPDREEILCCWHRCTKLMDAHIRD